MIADKRVIEAVSRMTGVSVEDLKRHPTPVLRLPDSMDSLDRAELVVELEEEFNEETVRTALHYVEVLTERPETRRSGGWPTSKSVWIDPLWDREMDG